MGMSIASVSGGAQGIRSYAASALEQVKKIGSGIGSLITSISQAVRPAKVRDSHPFVSGDRIANLRQQIRETFQGIAVMDKNIADLAKTRDRLGEKQRQLTSLHDSVGEFKDGGRDEAFVVLNSKGVLKLAPCEGWGKRLFRFDDVRGMQLLKEYGLDLWDKKSETLASGVLYEAIKERLNEAGRSYSSCQADIKAAEEDIGCLIKTNTQAQVALRDERVLAETYQLQYRACQKQLLAANGVVEALRGLSDAIDLEAMNGSGSSQSVHVAYCGKDGGWRIDAEPRKGAAAKREYAKADRMLRKYKVDEGRGADSRSPSIRSISVLRDRVAHVVESAVTSAADLTQQMDANARSWGDRKDTTLEFMSLDVDTASIYSDSSEHWHKAEDFGSVYGDDDVLMQMSQQAGSLPSSMQGWTEENIEAGQQGMLEDGDSDSLVFSGTEDVVTAANGDALATVGAAVDDVLRTTLSKQGAGSGRAVHAASLSKTARAPGMPFQTVWALERHSHATLADQIKAKHAEIVLAGRKGSGNTASFATGSRVFASGTQVPSSNGISAPSDAGTIGVTDGNNARGNAQMSPTGFQYRVPSSFISSFGKAAENRMSRSRAGSDATSQRHVESIGTNFSASVVKKSKMEEFITGGSSDVRQLQSEPDTQMDVERHRAAKNILEVLTGLPGVLESAMKKDGGGVDGGYVGYDIQNRTWVVSVGHWTLEQSAIANLKGDYSEAEDLLKECGISVALGPSSGLLPRYNIEDLADRVKFRMEGLTAEIASLERRMNENARTKGEDIFSTHSFMSPVGDDGPASNASHARSRDTRVRTMNSSVPNFFTRMFETSAVDSGGRSRAGSDAVSRSRIDGSGMNANAGSSAAEHHLFVNKPIPELKVHRHGTDALDNAARIRSKTVDLEVLKGLKGALESEAHNRDHGINVLYDKDKSAWTINDACGLDGPVSVAYLDAIKILSKCGVEESHFLIVGEPALFEYGYLHDNVGKRIRELVDEINGYSRVPHADAQREEAHRSSTQASMSQAGNDVPVGKAAGGMARDAGASRLGGDPESAPDFITGIADVPSSEPVRRSEDGAEPAPRRSRIRFETLKSDRFVTLDNAGSAGPTSSDA